MNDYEIDYKAMIEQMRNRIEELLKADEEYFALSKLVNEQKVFVEIVGKNLFDMKKTDQINALRILVSYGTLCKTLCDKYSLLDDGGGDEE